MVYKDMNEFHKSMDDWEKEMDAKDKQIQAEIDGYLGHYDDVEGKANSNFGYEKEEV